MRSRLAERLVSLAALLPLLAFVVAGIGYDRFRCTFTGEVSEMGCCPAEDPPAAPVVVYNDGTTTITSTQMSDGTYRLNAAASQVPCDPIDCNIKGP